jgi:hypothetical protein
MNENTTLINDVTEEIVETAAPAAAEAVGKAVAEYKITTADKVVAGGIIGLAVIGLGSLGYLAYKGGKALGKKIRLKAEEIKAQKENVHDDELAEILEDVECEMDAEEPVKKETKKSTK